MDRCGQADNWSTEVNSSTVRFRALCRITLHCRNENVTRMSLPEQAQCTAQWRAWRRTTLTSRPSDVQDDAPTSFDAERGLKAARRHHFASGGRWISKCCLLLTMWLHQKSTTNEGRGTSTRVQSSEQFGIVPNSSPEQPAGAPEAFACSAEGRCVGLGPVSEMPESHFYHSPSCCLLYTSPSPRDS